MTNDPNNHPTKPEQAAVSSIAEGEKAGSLDKPSRRDALAIIGKHTVYTAPAVLALLATHSKKVVAGSF